MNLTKLKEEMARRKGVLEGCFDKQQSAILSPSRQKAILTSRRAGKTNTVLRGMLLDAFENPDSKYAYIGLSRITAENIVWKELEFINDAHKLGIELQGYRLRANLPNRSSITLYGADQPGWIKKFKGAKYRECVIDEAGEFEIDLQDFIYRVIRPTLTDQLGKLWLIGTPGIVPSGFWWQVTRPDVENRARGWDLHRWHTMDNPFIKEQYQTDLVDLRNVYGTELETLPWFRREWLGEWCFDTEGNVYKYRPELSDIDNFVQQPGDKYVLAIDPGIVDACGFVVGCYNEARHDRLVFLECFKAPNLEVDEIISRIRSYQEQFPGLRIIGDESAAYVMQQIRNRGINIENSIKTEKINAISVFNNDLVAGRIKLLQPNCRPYAEEMFDLKRHYKLDDERKEGNVIVGKWKEHPKQANDLCDCGLYIHRICTAYNYTEPEPPIQHGSEEYYEKITNKLKDQARAKVSAPNHWWRT